jgi:hypothetical protein
MHRRRRVVAVVLAGCGTVLAVSATPAGADGPVRAPATSRPGRGGRARGLRSRSGRAGPDAVRRQVPARPRAQRRAAGPDVEITVTWTKADGQTGSYPLERFVDDGEYQYHFANPQPVPATPVTLTATSSRGGGTRATPAAWPGAQPPPTPAGCPVQLVRVAAAYQQAN